MAKQITISAPLCKDGKVQRYELVLGRVAWLWLGGKKHKCFMQADGALSDYATGGVFGQISDGKAYLMATSHGTSVPISMRDSAQALLDMLVNRHGAPRILEVIAKHEVLNK